MLPVHVALGPRGRRALGVQVGVGRLGPVVRLRDGVSVSVGVIGRGGFDVEVVVFAEGGEDVAPGLVRPSMAGDREIAGQLALDAAVTRVPSGALRNGVTEVV
jgi:hypothetical protein